MNEDFEQEQCEIETEDDVATCIYGDEVATENVDLDGDMNDYDYQQDLYNQW